MIVDKPMPLDFADPAIIGAHCLVEVAAVGHEIDDYDDGNGADFAEPIPVVTKGYETGGY